MATNQVTYLQPPSVADLESAVAQTSLNNVFTILARWRMSSQNSDQISSARPDLTATALLMALHCNRSDILSLLLAVSPTKVMPVKEAISAGHVANFQAFLWHGWDMNEPVEHDGPSALG